MIRIDDELKKIEEEQKINGVEYKYTIERLQILKTLEYVYSQLNKEEEEQLDAFIQEHMKYAKIYDETKHIFKKSMENGNGFINYENDLNKRREKADLCYAIIEKYLFNDLDKDYSNSGTHRS